VSSPLPFPVPTGDSSSSSPRTGLWDLSGLDPKSPIFARVGGRFSGTSHLEGADRAIAEKSAVTPITGSVADAVKYPIDQYTKDPAGYLKLQQAMFAAGFYGSTPASSIPWGSDPQGSTYDAWKKVLIATQQANAVGLDITPTDLLDDAVKRHQAATAGAQIPKPGLVIQQSDPAALRGLVQQAAQEALGRNLSTEEVNSFVDSFHRQEAAYSKKAYAAQQDNTGSTFQLTQPDANAQAKEFVEGGHPQEAGGQDLASYVGVLQQLLNGG
jgi:hypothetical protein